MAVPPWQHRGTDQPVTGEEWHDWLWSFIEDVQLEEAQRLQAQSEHQPAA